MSLEEVGVLYEKSGRLRRKSIYPGRRTDKVLFDDYPVVESGSQGYREKRDRLRRGSTKPARRIYKAACRDAPGASADGFVLEMRWLSFESRGLVFGVVVRVVARPRTDSTEHQVRGQWDARKCCPCLEIWIVVASRIPPLK